MKNFILKIWKDPVLSKVIAVGIVAIISLLYVKVISVIDKITFNTALNELLDLKIRVIYVLIVILIYLGIKMLLRKDKGRYSKKQLRLREFNQLKDSQTGILFRWGVYFHYNNGPFISDLTAFCTKHGTTPLRFIYNKCPVAGCENAKNSIDEYAIKNYIESELINKWDKT
ncbi:MAG: hypothetical protein Q8928_10240 [Bacteroidota bacterium]|nr:hypothetical protein [Bacteroidota bacterium]